MLITSFQCQTFAKGNNSKHYEIFFFFQFSPDYLLTILYNLTKFEAHSYHSFGDILITKYDYDFKKIRVNYF